MWRELLARLDFFANFRATRAEWSVRVGGPLTPSVANYLRLTHGEAASVPCQQHPACGGMHEIRPHSSGQFLAVSEDPERNCEAFLIDRIERAIFRFDIDQLVSEIAEALTLDEAISKVRRSPLLLRLGATAHDGSPVFLGVPGNPPESTRLVEITRRESVDSCILLLPTNGRLDTDTRRVAKASNIKLGFLDELITYHENRGWMAKQEMEDAFPAARRTDRPARLRLPKDTSWSDIVITLMNNEDIGIAHRSGNPHGQYTRRELGLEKQNGRETKAWKHLQACCSCGCIAFAPGAGTRDEHARNHMRKITESLRRAVAIQGPAFAESESPRNGSRVSNRMRGYWPFFRLRFQDIRLKPGLGNYPLPPDNESRDEEEY